MAKRGGARSECWCMRLVLLSLIGVQSEQFLLFDQTSTGTIFLGTVVMFDVRRREPLMDVREMPAVSTHGTENILTDHGLPAKRTRDLRRRGMTGRRYTMRIDLLEDLRSFVEVFPAM